MSSMVPDPEKIIVSLPLDRIRKFLPEFDTMPSDSSDIFSKLGEFRIQALMSPIADTDCEMVRKRPLKPKKVVERRSRGSVSSRSSSSSSSSSVSPTRSAYEPFSDPIRQIHPIPRKRSRSTSSTDSNFIDSKVKRKTLETSVPTSNKVRGRTSAKDVSRTQLPAALKSVSKPRPSLITRIDKRDPVKSFSKPQPSTVNPKRASEKKGVSKERASAVNRVNRRTPVRSVSRSRLTSVNTRVNKGTPTRAPANKQPTTRTQPAVNRVNGRTPRRVERRPANDQRTDSSDGIPSSGIDGRQEAVYCNRSVEILIKVFYNL